MTNKFKYLYLPLGISFFAWLIYLYTAAPAMEWNDALNFVDASVTLGVTAPPAPLYVILGHIFSLLPIGTYIFRLQFLSAILAAASLFLVYRITVWIADAIAIPKNHNPQDNPLHSAKEKRMEKLKIFAGVFSMLTLAFSYEYWTQAQNTDKYTLECFLMLLIFYLLLIVTEHKKKIFTVLLIACILLGLSLGTDPVVLCFFPSALFVLWDKSNNLNTQKISLLVLSGVAAVIVIYSYLPIASSRNPFLNWGRPTTLSAMWTLATGEGQNNATNGLTESGSIYASSMGHYFVMLWLDFTPIILPFILLGGWYVFKKQRHIFWVLTLIVICNLILSVLYFSGNQESWYLLSDVCFAIFAGLGLLWITEKVRKDWIVILLFILSFSPLIYWWGGADRHGWNLTNDYITNLYNPIKAPAIFFGGADTFVNYSYYVHDVSQYKPGVIPVLARLFYIYTPYQEDLAATTDIKIPNPTRYYSVNSPSIVSAVGYSAFVNDFFAANIQKYTIYIDDPALHTAYPDLSRPDGSPSFQLDTNRFRLIPSGLVYQVVPKNSTLQPNPQNYQFQFSDVSTGFPKKLPTVLEHENANELQSLIKQYVIAYITIGDYTVETGNSNQALQYYQDAYAMDPHNGAILSELGLYYVTHNLPEEALPYYQQGAQSYPSDPQWLFNEAVAYGELGKANQAVALLQQVVSQTPNGSLLNQKANAVLNKLQGGN